MPLKTFILLITLMAFGQNLLADNLGVFMEANPKNNVILSGVEYNLLKNNKIDIYPYDKNKVNDIYISNVKLGSLKFNILNSKISNPSYFLSLKLVDLNLFLKPFGYNEFDFFKTNFNLQILDFNRDLTFKKDYNYIQIGINKNFLYFRESNHFNEKESFKSNYIYQNIQFTSGYSSLEPDLLNYNITELKKINGFNYKIQSTVYFTYYPIRIIVYGNYEKLIVNKIVNYLKYGIKFQLPFNSNVVNTDDCLSPKDYHAIVNEEYICELGFN